MNSQQINYFMAVASNLSFTKTSEELFVSQPAISRQIAGLEKELGVRLFNRSNHRTELTAAGQLYYDFFSQSKTQLRNIQQKISRMESGIREHVTIGIMDGWDIFPLLQELLAVFQKHHPDADLSFDFLGLKEIKTMLLTGGIDLALTLRSRIFDADEILCQDCTSLQKILIVSKNHPQYQKAKSKNTPLTPYDLREEVFFAPWENAEENISEDITGYLSPYGFTPRLQFLHNASSVLCAVRCGQGAAIVNTWSSAAGDPEICKIPLDIHDHVCLARIRDMEKEHTPAAASCLSLLIQDHKQPRL
ncbi:MAG: LysR family transcriptional regulator [Clostridiales bacterium]|jgi:DNA-binding transcriptional LysR family regulator|nr:LysR family transcriptional regulator [Clostridiales bacterium]